LTFFARNSSPITLGIIISPLNISEIVQRSSDLKIAPDAAVKANINENPLHYPFLKI